MSDNAIIYKDARLLHYFLFPKILTIKSFYQNFIENYQDIKQTTRSHHPNLKITNI